MRAKGSFRPKRVRGEEIGVDGGAYFQKMEGKRGDGVAGKTGVAHRPFIERNEPVLGS
jgi:hypothetical protein